MSDIIDILVVDSNSRNVEKFCHQIQTESSGSFHFTTVHSAAHAIIYIQKKTPSCLLLQYELRDINGLKFLEMITNGPGKTPFPVVMMFESSNEETAIASLKKGAHDYLVKDTLTKEILAQTIHNAMDYHQLQKQFEQKNNFLRIVLDNIYQGVCVYNKDFKLAEWNRRFVELLQFPPNFLRIGLNIEEVIRFNATRGEYGEGDPEQLVAARMNEIHNNAEVQPHCYDRKRKDGTYIEVRGNRLPEGGLITTYSDVTDRKLLEFEIKRLALNDPLTKLANRHLFQTRFQEAINSAARLGKMVAVLYLDLNGFKPVNDTYGHPVGDELLKLIAERLTNQIRSIDTAARLGGDEFAILINYLENPQAVAVPIERVLRVFASPFVTKQNLTLTVGTAIGVSFYPNDDSDMQELLRKADLALYTAKKSKQNLCFYSTELEDANRNPETD